MKLKDDYIIHKVAGTYVVVPTGKASMDFSGVITLNTTGAFLWDQLALDKSEEALLEVLLEEYDIDEVTAKADVLDFVNTLKAADLIE